MRPKLLEIEGLQSFRENQKIDFESLGETGLFGIFGSTGSGKSTVLDAITFALYGKVKRADRGTQGIINTNMDTAAVYFTFEILKGSVRKVYRAERIYRRKKGTQNSCEPRVVRLIEVTKTGDIPVCDRASEVSGCIEELLGLNHDDFIRAVVLPQNSFQEFLMLDNSRKREMLERIFYLEEYGKQLLEKINRKMAGLKSRIDSLSGELKGYSDATFEAVEEAKNGVETASTERTRVEKEFKLLETEFNEAKEVWQYVQDFEFISQREGEHLSLKEKVNRKKLTLDKAVKADELSETILKNRELAGKLKETEIMLNQTENDLADVTDDLNRIRRKYDGVKNKALTEQPKLVELKTKLLNAISIKNEMNEIQKKINETLKLSEKLKDETAVKSTAILKEEEELERLEQSVGNLVMEIKAMSVDPEYRYRIQEGVKLENEVEALKVNTVEMNEKRVVLQGVVNNLEKKLQKVREKIKFMEKSLEDMEGEKQKDQVLIPEERKLIFEFKECLNSLQVVCDVLEAKKTDLSDMHTRKEKYDLLLNELSVRMEAQEADIEKKKSIYEQRKTEHENAVGEMNKNMAYMLSKSLTEGVPCPVCGSKQHPEPAAGMGEADPAVLERHAELAEKRLADAEKVLRQAEKEALITGEQKNSLTHQQDVAIKELELKTADYNKEILKLPPELRETEPDQLSISADKMREQYNELQKAYELREKKLEEYNKRIHIMKDELGRNKMDESGIISELRVNRENLEHIENTCRVSKEKWKEKCQEYSDFLRKYIVEGASSELNSITEKDRKADSLQKQMEKSRELSEVKRLFINKCREEISDINGESIKIQTEINNLLERKKEKEKKLWELSGDACVEDEILHIDNKLQEYRDQEKQYQERLNSVEKQYNNLMSEKSTLKNQYAIYSESLKKEGIVLEASLVEKGFKGIDEVEESIIPKEEQRELKVGIEAYDQAGINISVQKEMLQKKLKSRYITEEEWNKTSGRYQEILEYKEACVTRSEVLKNRFDLLTDKHNRWVELSKAYSEAAERYALFDHIQKLLKAERGKDNSFIDYIAEERLRYAAAKASETLGIMTKYRLVLELDANAGFIIRDNANGGVHRMVTSLSGGETFLTSLSLALALSEQIQLKGQSPLEFFFLDEGFGTLDNNLLDNVIDSLERLSKKERIIGLISHVPELRSRIARRLIIDPPSIHGDGSKVRIEKS